jgi:hypothetical protein
MTAAHVEQLITAQTALIAALDTRDAGAIETTTRALADAAAALRAHDSWRDGATLRERLGHALKQTDAARIRINYLSDWTRQRIDSISELRGGALTQTYANPYKPGKKTARA